MKKKIIYLMRKSLESNQTLSKSEEDEIDDDFDLEMN